MAIGDRSRLVRLPEGQIRRIRQRRLSEGTGPPARSVGPIRRVAPSDAPTLFPLGGATLEPRELSLSEIAAGTHGRTPLDWLPSRDPSAEQVLIRADRSRKLRVAMERLSRQEREVLALRFGLDDRPTDPAGGRAPARIEQRADPPDLAAREVEAGGLPEERRASDSVAPGVERLGTDG
jgi:hypothetical protein